MFNPGLTQIGLWTTRPSTIDYLLLAIVPTFPCLDKAFVTLHLEFEPLLQSKPRFARWFGQIFMSVTFDVILKRDARLRISSILFSVPGRGEWEDGTPPKHGWGGVAGTSKPWSCSRVKSLTNIPCYRVKSLKTISCSRENLVLACV